MKDIKPRIKALGIYEIAGGVIGIVLTLRYLLSLNPLPGFLLMLIILFAFGLYVYSIYSGILLFKNAKKGLIHSRINQLLQIGSVSMFGYAFQYVSGLYFFIGLDFTESRSFKLNLGISTWQIYINTGSHDLVVGLNVVALFLIIAIEKLFKNIEKFEENQQIAVIGKTDDVVR